MRPDPKPTIPEGAPGAVPTIDLDSIRLRPFEMSDLDFVRASSEDSYIPTFTTVPPNWTEEAGREFIVRQKGRLEEGAGYPFVIERVSTPGAVGFIGFWFRQFDQGHMTFGYWTLPSARRSGVMAEALLGLSDWGFGNIDCDRHRLYIEEWNIGSQKTGERAGFIHQPGITAEEVIGGETKELLVWDRPRPQ